MYVVLVSILLYLDHDGIVQQSKTAVITNGMAECRHIQRQLEHHPIRSPFIAGFFYCEVRNELALS